MASQKITPCIWTDSRIEEQAKFYTSVFPNSKIKETEKYGEAGPLPKGAPMVVMLEANGVEFMLLNGGDADFKPNESISFMVHCETQKEVDAYWEKLISGGGEVSMCGWLKDKYGISWQIIPNALLRLQADKDRAKANRVMQAMLKMRKIDIPTLERAAAAG
jgi:predicted 3-demethylubiquinone-9 3-methyltransferase (glyoxalase superfamily)